MNQKVKTTCPYCGVGCGIVAEVDEQGRVGISGDKEHPANYGRLCSKGAALADTLSLEGRLLHPEIDGGQVDWDTAINSVSEKFTGYINEFGPDSIAFYVSGQLLSEDYYVANKFIKGFIGTANIDTNSRLCMASSVAGHKRAFGSDTVPCAYEDLERAKLIVLVGSNTAWCHPVLFQRIKKAKQDNNDLRIVVIDPRQTATCDIADLHLPLHPGTDSILFNGLFAYLADNDEQNILFTDNHTEGLQDALQAARSSAASVQQVAQTCQLDEGDVAEFYRLFTRTERVVSVYSQGINQSSSGSDKVNAIINCHLITGRIGRPGMGPFSFTGQPNAMGGREVGGLANQLTAHMEIENPEHRALVQEFWQSPRMVHKPGLKAVDLFNEIKSGKIKAVWIMSTNPVVSLPDADQVKVALTKCEYVVVSECVRSTDTTQFAHVLLPALTWGEKEGTVTNSERRISRQKCFLPLPGEARADWWTVCQVAKKMGYAQGFNYESSHEIFKEYAALSGYKNGGSRDFDISVLKDIEKRAYDDFYPLQWPVRIDKDAIQADQPRWQGVKRMFADGKFFTPSGKAQFIAVNPCRPKNPLTMEYPLVLNTGRIRDQWHTMTRTAKAAKLNQHSPEPYAEFHTADAANLALINGGLVNIVSQWGEIIVRAKVAYEHRPGSVFVPMHWNGQFASNARVDTVVNPVLDPVSGQPEFKHTPVKAFPYHPNWHGFLLTRRELPSPRTRYWVKSRCAGFFRYELAGEDDPDDWSKWAREYLCTSQNDVNWIEYLDTAAKQYRGIRLLGNHLESCIFIGPTPELPSRDWLSSLFAKEGITDDERNSLLTGAPPKGQTDQGKTVCACFGIGEKTIIDTIVQNKLTSVAEIGTVLQAGTNCGSCVPELHAILLSSQHKNQQAG